jgi:hypothetical protein
VWLYEGFALIAASQFEKTTPHLNAAEIWDIVSAQERGLELSERLWRGDFAWLQARSLFFDDPEGNTIELIAHDPSVAGDMLSS